MRVKVFTALLVATVAFGCGDSSAPSSQPAPQQPADAGTTPSPAPLDPNTLPIHALRQLQRKALRALAGTEACERYASRTAIGLGILARDIEGALTSLADGEAATTIAVLAAQIETNARALSKLTPERDDLAGRHLELWAAMIDAASALAELSAAAPDGKEAIRDAAARAQNALSNVSVTIELINELCT